MMEAERLHREAALLSNTLADFDADDVARRKTVVDQIIDLRERWKDARWKIDTGQDRRKQRDDQAKKPTEIRLGMSEAEIRVELGKVRVNISKYKTKLDERPDHGKAGEWAQELSRLLAIKEQYETELIRLSYETA